MKHQVLTFTTALISLSVIAGTAQAAPPSTDTISSSVARASTLDPSRSLQKVGDIENIGQDTIETSGSGGKLKITAADKIHSRTISNSTGSSLFTVLNSPGKKAYFTASIPSGYQLEKTSDGGIDVTGRINGVKLVYAHVNAPYAVDATGKTVATKYDISGNTISQSVSQNAKFPVTADPKISYGWGIYIGAWGRDWTTLGKLSLAAGAGAVVGSCVAAAWVPTIWTKVLATVCGFVGLGSMNTLTRWVKGIVKSHSSFDPNACYQIQIPNIDGFKKVSSSKC